MDGPDAWVDAMAAAKEVTGTWGGVCAVNGDTATNWRIFQSLYSQLGGEVIADNGTRIVLDDDKAMQVLEYLRGLTVEKELMPADVDYGGSVAMFASGDGGSTPRASGRSRPSRPPKMPFSMTLFPNVYGATTTTCRATCTRSCSPAAGPVAGAHGQVRCPSAPCSTRASPGPRAGTCRPGCP